MARRSAMLVLAACLLAALGGCAEDGGREAAIDRSEEIEADGFLEVNLQMNESAELSYRWSTRPATELAFDVHSHPSSDEVTYHERRNATEAEGTFTAPEAGSYSLLWENPSEQAVTVDLQIDGDFELASVAP